MIITLFQDDLIFSNVDNSPALYPAADGYNFIVNNRRGRYVIPKYPAKVQLL